MNIHVKCFSYQFPRLEKTHMSLTIPVSIAAILPLLSTALSSYLNDDHLKPRTNALIAFVAILGTATGCELLTGNFTGNWSVSVLGIIGYVALLMHGDLSVLYAFLMLTRSPLAPSPWVQPLRTSPVTRAYTPPTPIILPPDANPVPPRASAPTDTPSA
jgi:hypothetical protein